MADTDQITNLQTVENNNDRLPKDNSSIDFYVNIDRNYVPLAGADKILPVEHVTSFVGINPEELIGVRTMLKGAYFEKNIEFTLTFRKHYSFSSDDFEVVLYQNNSGLHEPTKILRLNKQRSVDPFYGVKDSQRESYNMNGKIKN